MVALGDGSFGLLPEQWLARQALLGEIGETRGDKIRFSRPQAALVDSWLEEESGVELDKAFVKLRKELAGFGGIAAADPPRSFRGPLRDYQREGLGWLHFLAALRTRRLPGRRHGARQDRSGARAARARGGGRRGKAVASGVDAVVVPRSLVFNWRREAERFTPSSAVLDHSGVGRRSKRSTANSRVRSRDHHLRHAATRHRASLPRSRSTTRSSTKAQAIKNASTASAKAARLLRADHRLAMTGTPIENRLEELWSLFEFLNPGMLGRSSTLRAASPDSPAWATLPRRRATCSPVRCGR